MAGHQGYTSAAPAPDEPSLMPGLPFVVSLIARAVGAADLWQARAVVLAATLLIAIVMFTVIRIETSSWTLAVAGAGSVVMGLAILAGQPGDPRHGRPL